MSRKHLTDEQKNHIVMFYTSKNNTYSQREIANIMGIHRKSVYNVLKENGLLEQVVPVTTEQHALLKAVSLLGLSYHAAIKVLVTPPEVLAVNYLHSLTPKQLAKFYYTHLFKQEDATANA